MKIIYLSFATASITFTIIETNLFKPYREFLKGKNRFLNSLMSCGYCFGYWIAFILVVICQPEIFTTLQPFNYLLTTLIVAWLSAFQYAMMRWLWNEVKI